jgi:hypothetical protein
LTIIPLKLSILLQISYKTPSSENFSINENLKIFLFKKIERVHNANGLIKKIILQYKLIQIIKNIDKYQLKKTNLQMDEIYLACTQ